MTDSQVSRSLKTTVLHRYCSRVAGSYAYREMQIHSHHTTREHPMDFTSACARLYMMPLREHSGSMIASPRTLMLFWKWCSRLLVWLTIPQQTLARITNSSQCYTKDITVATTIGVCGVSVMICLSMLTTRPAHV